MAAVPVWSCLLTVLVMWSLPGVGSIDCYDCVSVSGNNLACEDEFKQDLSTYHFISRACQYTFFAASHCFKLKGIRKDGTHFMVRGCSDVDWGDNCGGIRYFTGNKIELIQGCLVSCNYNGCNAAPRLQHRAFSSLALLYLLMGIGLVAVQGWEWVWRL